MPPLLLSVKGEEIIVRLSLSASKQCYKTCFFICAYTDNMLMKSREIILHCLRYSCMSAVREKSSATLYSEAFRSCSCFSTHQSFLKNGRVEVDTSVTASECERLR